MNAAEKCLGKREKQILCGLFLSKYDREGLRFLGFSSFGEAFNTLGYGLGAPPASIKNYRDELDPYVSIKRKGWHQRPIRSHCKRILEDYQTMGLKDMGCLVKRLILPSSALQSEPDVGKILKTFEGPDSTFAKRLMTGRAAEEYFLRHYESVSEFTGMSVTDTTQWGCGFDFKMSHDDNNGFSAVEVKGMHRKSGHIQLTEMEHAMAEELTDRFYLFVVRDFGEKPFHSVFRNPLIHDLSFQRIERMEPHILWQASV